jgi:hypothetical protein
MCHYTGRVVSSLLSSSLLFLLPFEKWKRGTSTGTDGRDHNMRESFVVPVNSQRREMAGNVILYVSPSPSPVSIIPSFLYRYNPLRWLRLIFGAVLITSSTRSHPASDSGPQCHPTSHQPNVPGRDWSRG